MAVITRDPRVDAVLANIERMVASEGGAFESATLDEPRLTVKYRPGVNESCPECVPTHDAVKRWLELSLERQAPYVAEVEVV